MTKRLLFILSLSLAFGTMMFWPTPQASAAYRPIIISKTMRNVTLGTTYVGSQAATVKSTSDVVQVNLVISIPGDTIATDVTITDVFAESDKTWSFLSSISFYSGGLNASGNCNGGPLGSLATTDSPTGSPNERKFTIGGGVLLGEKQFCIQYDGKPASTIFPTFKSRLVGHPVFIEEEGALSAKTLADIAYLYYIPQFVSDRSQSSFLYGNKDTELDLWTLVPGVSVRVANATDGLDIKDITTSPVYVLQPNPSGLVGADSTTKQCSVSASQRNRGGACLFTTQAIVSDSGSSRELGSARAYFMALPASTIIGNVYSGSAALDSDSLLLPGEHAAGSATGGKSLSKETLSYSIAPNAVNGWDSGQVYKNVYQNANVSRLKRSPDIAIDNKANCDLFKVSSPVITACTVTSGVLTVDMKKVADYNLDLSSSDLTTPNPSARKNDFVLYIKGNLTIGNAASLNKITNMVGGTIIVEGKLIIQNVAIEKGPNAGSLGFIVLGNNSGGADAVRWRNTIGSNDNALNGVAFFVPSGTFTATKSSTGTMRLIGSIVARFVDLSNVDPVISTDPATDAADKSGITIEYDQNLSTSPPPGFQLFSSSPVLNDLAP